MPFDALPVNTVDAIIIVDRMIATLNDPAHWCQGYLVFRQEPGVAPAYCLIGALREAQSERPGVLAQGYTDAGRKVAKELRRVVRMPVSMFNDNYGHQAVMAALFKLRQRLTGAMT